MTMSREMIRRQMQEQRPTRKRQLCEVSPSPPKKLRSLPGGSPSSSPKGPLLINSDDESPRFRTTSFYGSRKKLVLTKPSGDTDNSSVAHQSQVAVTTPRSRSSTRMSTRSSTGKRNGEDTTTHRLALSPIKNIYHNGTKQRTKTTSETNGNCQRKKSVPPKAKLNVSRKSPKEPQDSSDDELLESVTPGKPRKFFKYKSPASASKASGGIIIRKGFDLKFVRGSVNGRSGKSTCKKTVSDKRANAKTKQSLNKKTSKMKTMVQRKPEISESAIRRESQDSRSNGKTPDLSDVPKWNRKASTQGISYQDSSELMPMSMTVSNKKFDKESDKSSSENLFGFDNESMASDLSGPIEQSSSSTGTQQSVVSSVDEAHHGKFYSIFSQKQFNRRQAAVESSSSSTSGIAKDSPLNKKFIVSRGDDRQLILDAGQEQFGATQCKICGMVYSPGDAADEATHWKFHLSAVTALKFTGWKKERVIKDFLDNGSRVIIVLPDDQRFMVKKVEDVNKVMGQELGFSDHVFSFHGSYKAFLYISDEKRVEGCCIAEPISQGYRILPPSRELSDSQRPWLCSSVPEPATVGIGRLWVYGPSRKHGVASRLLDCVRQWFEYGFMIHKSQLAFSDPTPDGRMFAAKYTGTDNFLVYKYFH
ncbi:uncharacterized protein LOC143279996 isoform X2 [Babylonia areolata]